MGCSVKNDSLPGRGERVAAVVEKIMARERLCAGSLAMRIRADKRDVRRLLNERSCGSRLEDQLAQAFGWDFIEAVFTPVIGADPITAREKEIERERAEIAAREVRLDRLRAARSATDRGPRLAIVEDRTWAAPHRREP